MKWQVPTNKKEGKVQRKKRVQTRKEKAQIKRQKPTLIAAKRTSLRAKSKPKILSLPVLTKQLQIRIM